MNFGGYSLAMGTKSPACSRGIHLGLITSKTAVSGHAIADDLAKNIKSNLFPRCFFLFALTQQQRS